MIRFCLLGSGSSGNAVLVRSNDTKILIDNGLSLKQLELRAAQVGETLEDVKAVLVTHEHGDHVRGLGTFSRRYPVPVLMTPGTQRALPDGLGKVERIETFEAGETLAVGSLAVETFSVTHDAADPVSFVVQSQGVKLGIVGDLGQVNALVEDRLSGSHGLILESNYCEEMIVNGPYPWAVKQRIQGHHGHLSNEMACKLLAAILHEGLKLVVLTHISRENNTPERALQRICGVVKDRPTRVHVAMQDQPTEMFEIAV